MRNGGEFHLQVGDCVTVVWIYVYILRDAVKCDSVQSRPADWDVKQPNCRSLGCDVPPPPSYYSQMYFKDQHLECNKSSVSVRVLL